MIAAGVATCFLAIHVCLLILFATCGVMEMAYFNIFSVLFYVGCYVLIWRKLFRTFVYATFVEVELHMFMAVQFVGWDAGFQVTLVGVTMLGFFADYVGRSVHLHTIRAVPMTIIGAFVYLAAFITTFGHPSPYEFADQVEFWLQIIWAVVTFSITGLCMAAFTWITFNSEQQLSTEVSHDQLTGLPNRYFMSDYLKKTASDEGLCGYWLAIADIDDFKEINDTYGHNCGDQVLKALGDMLLASEGRTKVCRWGGEEFLIVGKSEDSLDAVLEGLDRLRAAISVHSFWYEKNRLDFTVTMGVAIYERGETVIEWINRADKKLYEGKRSGKNKVVM